MMPVTFSAENRMASPPVRPTREITNRDADRRCRRGGAGGAEPPSRSRGSAIRLGGAAVLEAVERGEKTGGRLRCSITIRLPCPAPLPGASRGRRRGKTPPGEVLAKIGLGRVRGLTVKCPAKPNQPIQVHGEGYPSIVVQIGRRFEDEGGGDGLVTLFALELKACN